MNVKRTRTGWMIGLVAAATLLLAGCSADDNKKENGNETAAATDHTGHAAPSAEASATPEAAQTYTLEATAQQQDGKFIVNVTTNLKFSEQNYGGKHVEGEGHIHFYSNGVVKGPIMKNGAYEVDPAWLKDGDNAIKLTLAGNNHSEPYGASVELTLTK